MKTSAAHSPPSWGSMVVLGCVFAVGVAAGSFGWQARERAVEEATAAAEAELVAGPVTVESWPDGREAAPWWELTAAVYNLGSREVTALAAWPSGWSVAEAGTPTTLPPDEWTVLPLTVVPECAAAVEPELELVVRTDAGEQELTLPLQPRDGTVYWGRMRQSMCGEQQEGVVLDGLTTRRGDGHLEMSLDLRHPGSPDASEIVVTEVYRDTAGFHAAGSGLPLAIRGGDTGTARVVWTVEACELTDDLGDLAVALRLESDSVSREQTVQLPGSAVAALARFGVSECG